MSSLYHMKKPPTLNVAENASSASVSARDVTAVPLRMCEECARRMLSCYS